MKQLKRAVQIAGLFKERFAGLQFPNGEKITISLGVTEMIGGESADKACTRVDSALYEAKNTGRNRVIVHQQQTLAMYRELNKELEAMSGQNLATVNYLLMTVSK